LQSTGIEHNEILIITTELIGNIRLYFLLVSWQALLPVLLESFLALLPLRTTSCALRLIWPLI